MVWCHFKHDFLLLCVENCRRSRARAGDPPGLPPQPSKRCVLLSLLLSLLLLCLVFSFPLLCLVFSPVLPCASQHTDIFNISASVSIPFQTEPIFFYLLCVYWATSHFFPSLCTIGIYLCLILPVFIRRDLVIARLKEPFSVLISLGVP